MFRIILFATLFLGFVQNSIGQSFNWAIKQGSTGSDITRVTTTDAQNNIYCLVNYYGTLTIDSAGTPKTFTSAGNRDVAIIKYNCNKVFQWVVKVGGPLFDGGNYNIGGIKVDSNGNVYASSSINGSANFISANGNTTVKTSYGQYDGFILKTNSSGIIQWINLIGSTAGNDEGGGLAIDRDQNVYMTGLFFNTATCQSIGSASQTLTSFGNGDILLLKYSPTGSLIYANRGGGNLLDEGSYIAVDSSGNAYVAGNIGCCGNSFVNFGANNLNNTGSWGGFIAKADINGNWLWGNGMGSANGESICDVVVNDYTDRVYVAGHFQGNSLFTTRPGGTAQTLTGTNSNYDVVVAAMNLNGATQWARTFGGTGNDYGLGIDLDKSGNVVVSGDFTGTTNFGGSSLTVSGAASAFVARYSPNNVLIDVQKVGNGGYTSGQNVHVSPSGLTYLSGYFTGQTIVGSDTITSAGTEDGFVARVQFADSTIIAADNSLLNCTGDTSILYVPNKRIGTFSWYRNDTLITSTNGNQISISTPGTYKVISTNNCAAADTSVNLVITRSPYYRGTPISGMTLCTGDSGRFNALGADTYRWRPALGLSDTAVANPYVKPTVNTTYYLTRTLNGCISLDTSIITLSTNCCLTCATPLSLNQGVVACYPFTGNANDESGNGNNATAFNAALTTDRFAVANRAYLFNGFSSYLEVPNSPSLQSPSNNVTFTFWARVTSWNFNAGVQYNPILSKSNTTTSAQYRAMIRNNGAYAMTSTGNSFNGVIGGVTNTNTWYFFAISVSNDTLYYYRNGALLGFATGPVPFTINSTTPLRIGRNDVNTPAYFAGSLDEVRIYGRTLSAASILALYNLSNINGKPTITAGANKNICKGDSVQLTTFGSTGTYLWTPSTYLSSDTLKSPWDKADSTTNYIVRVNVSGCYNYDTVLVNVTNFQPFIGSDRAICKGDTTTLIVQNGGNTFAWTPNYKIAPTNNDTVRVWPLVDTNYIVTSNNGLCIRRDTVRINVTTPTVNGGLDQNVCLHDTAHFNVITNGTVRWSPLTYLSDSIGTNLYSVPDSNITYILTANYLGCLARDTVKVSVAVLPIDAGPNQIICRGDSVQLNATGATNFIWIPNYNISDSSIYNPWVKPLVPTYYYVISYNLLCSRYDSVYINVKQASAIAGPDKDICNGDSVQLHASVIGPYTWSPVSALSDTSLQPYAKPLVTTPYILSVNNSGCLASDTVVVRVTNFNIDAGNAKSICKGDSVQLQATGGVKYNWLPVYNISDTGIANPWVKPLAPINYYLLSTNGICLRVDTVFVDVKTINASAGKDTSMCYGYFVTLNATGGASYQWMNNYNLSDPNIANPLATPAKDTTYIVKISDGGACSIYDSVFVDVSIFPTVSAGPDLNHCAGDFVLINGSVTDYTRFFWSPALGLNDKLLMQPTASVTGQQMYILNAWNNYCYMSDTLVVKANPKVVAAFNADPSSGIAPLPVVFTNKSSNGYFFDWDLGEIGAFSNDENPTYTYKNEGVYNVLLTVKDSLGCTDTISKTIRVNVIETLFAPDAFTPNNDGLNDVFAFTYSPNRFEYVEVEIFNRWGVKVFETKMPGGAWWDGKINGSPEPPGIFTYYATARDKKGKSYELSGTVTLIR
ncbi:MAG: hypothetical protein CFE21_16890 [Bacteroidetes bacterium B1(2017)]|nr:MAG: hypothetical protein CFE21_16890 [Bacteroidetes bacterium B1(2017)]